MRIKTRRKQDQKCVENASKSTNNFSFNKKDRTIVTKFRDETLPAHTLDLYHIKQQSKQELLVKVYHYNKTAQNYQDFH